MCRHILLSEILRKENLPPMQQTEVTPGRAEEILCVFFKESCARMLSGDFAMGRIDQTRFNHAAMDPEQQSGYDGDADSMAPGERDTPIQELDEPAPERIHIDLTSPMNE